MIKRLIATLTALLLLTSQVLATDWLINSYRFGLPGVDLTLTDQDSSTTNSTSYSFTNQTLGAAAADRVIVITVHSRSGDGAIITTTAVTVAGISASLVIEQNNAASGNDSHVSMWHVKVPSGTTGTVAVTMTGSPGRCAITVHRITGGHLQAHDTLGAEGNDPTGTIDIPAQGAALAASFTGGATGVTWTGLTEDVDAAVESQQYSTATDEFSTVQTGRTITSDFGSPNESVMAVASWGPSSTPLSDPTLTFLQCSTENTSDLTTYTFSSQNTGTASNARYTLGAAIVEDGAGTLNIASVSVGGTSAQIAAAYNSSTLFVAVAIFIVGNPAGTSESVVITASEAVINARVCLWQLDNISTPSIVDFGTDEASGGGVLDLDSDVSANGVAVGICGTSAAGATYSWSGLTERSEGNAGEHSMSVADFTNDASADAPLAASCDPSTGTGGGVMGTFR